MYDGFEDKAEIPHIYIAGFLSNFIDFQIGALQQRRGLFDALLSQQHGEAYEARYFQVLFYEQNFLDENKID
jgi:uncharacterized membrane protein